MYRYDYYYGHWDSDDSSDGGNDNYRPNTGEGGRDTGYIPSAPAPPPPTPPPVTSLLKEVTPAVITLNGTTESTGGGYKPAGQFTESRAMTICHANGTKNGVTKVIVGRNERAAYTEIRAPGMDKEIYRFPYYVPPGANKATLPKPVIKWEHTVRRTGGGPGTSTMAVYAHPLRPDLGSDGVDFSNSTLVIPTNNVLQFSSGEKVHTLNNNQMLDFVEGWNEYLFTVQVNDSAELNLDNTVTGNKIRWWITSISTSVPDGYDFELKMARNWETYFGINVVKSTDRNSKGVATQLLTTPNYGLQMQPPSWSVNTSCSYNEYSGTQGYKHWEIPTNKFLGNWEFQLPIMVYGPDNEEFASMEPTYKTPGPAAPWNLLSRHETFYDAVYWLRPTDYPQRIGPNQVPIFYAPKSWKGVVYLKKGVASNDTLL